MRQFDLHPVEFQDGATLEHDAIGALLLDDDGYELEWEDPDLAEDLEERLEDLLESEIYDIGPHPNPAIRGTVRRDLEVGTDEWLSKVASLLEGPAFRLRLREATSR